MRKINKSCRIPLRFVKIFSGLSLLILCQVFRSFAQEVVSDKAYNLRDMTLHVIPQSHIDLAWWWRYRPETVDVIVTHTLETAFQNMEKFPDYTFTFLQVPAIAPLETAYPEIFYKLRYYVHRPSALEGKIKNPGASGSAGRLAIGSALWCEVDGCLPCGESLVRQCLYGKRYFWHAFGIDVRTAWFQDAWTHPWTYPQILKKSGIDSYMFTRPRGEGEQMFWWESPDGSRVLAYKPLKEGGDNLPAQEEIDAYLKTLKKRYGIRDGLTLIGVGNHGGGALAADVARMREVMNQRNTKPAASQLPARLIFSTPAQYIESIKSNITGLPVIKDELTPTIRGAYTTVGEIKKNNRYTENLLLTWEKISTIASAINGLTYQRDKIMSAWEKIMLNQFHDTISGTDIPTSITDALDRYKEVLLTGRQELLHGLTSICSRINTEGEGLALIVFNPLSWQRTDLAELKIELPQRDQPFEIVDHQGKKIVYQIINDTYKNNTRSVTLLFLAENLPSLGYKCFWLHPVKSQPVFQHMLKAGREKMENEFFEIHLDPVSGCLKSIYDKLNQREILDITACANQIQILTDYGDSEGFLKSAGGVSEYNRWDGPYQQTDPNPQISVVENGPQRAMIRLKKKFGLARFNQTIKIYRGIRRIDFDMAINWIGTNKMIKISFPLSIKNSQATYEIPYGTIQRTSRGEEQVAQQWVDISKNDYGVSLLNDSRYGHDITENTIRLSVLRSPDHPVWANDEQGIHKIKYALLPHQDNWRQAGVIRRAFEFNNPLLVVSESTHNGDLPAEHAFVEIEPDNLILTVLKKAEDSEDMIIRFYETLGEPCTARIDLSPFFETDAVYKTDLLENTVADVKMEENHFDLNVSAYSIESVKLIQDSF